MLKLVERITFVFAVFTLVACAPRGESKSLSEIYEKEQGRFERVMLESSQKAGAQKAGAQNVSELYTLQSALKQNLAEVDIANVLGALDALIPKAGYTTRPALTEIRNQYAHLNSSAGGNEAAYKLLKSRTYGLLADELETTGFKLG